MRLRGIDHIQLAMPAGGEALARGFYGEILGLPEKEKPPALAARGGAWFEREHEAFGFDTWGSGFGERLDRLDESVMRCQACHGAARHREREHAGGEAHRARR